MKKITTPLAAVVLALAARDAAATPVDGLARCALNDVATFSAAPADTVSCTGPELCTDADDLSLAEDPGTDEQRVDVATALVADTGARNALRAPTIMARALTAIGSYIAVPLKYGCALIGAEKDPRPAAKKKPRMLTLF